MPPKSELCVVLVAFRVTDRELSAALSSKLSKLPDFLLDMTSRRLLPGQYLVGSAKSVISPCGSMVPEHLKSLLQKTRADPIGKEVQEEAQSLHELAKSAAKQAASHARYSVSPNLLYHLELLHLREAHAALQEFRRNCSCDRCPTLLLESKESNRVVGYACKQGQLRLLPATLPLPFLLQGLPSREASPLEKQKAWHRVESNFCLLYHKRKQQIDQNVWAQIDLGLLP